MWRSCPSLLIILRLLTPLTWGKKKKKPSHWSPQAIRMAVYDASQWGCAQLRPANGTRMFGTRTSLGNIILSVHQPQTGPAEKAKDSCCLGVNCWRRPGGQIKKTKKNSSFLVVSRQSDSQPTLSFAVMEVPRRRGADNKSGQITAGHLTTMTVTLTGNPESPSPTFHTKSCWLQPLFQGWAEERGPNQEEKKKKEKKRKAWKRSEMSPANISEIIWKWAALLKRSALN